MNSYEIAGKLKLSQLHQEAQQARLYRLLQSKRLAIWRWF